MRLRIVRPSRATWRRVRRTAGQAVIAAAGAGLVLSVLRHDMSGLLDAAAAAGTVVLTALAHNWAEDQPAVPDSRPEADQ